MTSAMNWLAACASSLGGPGRKREEQSGGKSTLGTLQLRTEITNCLVTVQILHIITQIFSTSASNIFLPM